MSLPLRIMTILAFHFVPLVVLAFGLSLAADRWRFSAPDQGHDAEVVAMAERRVSGGAEGENRLRDERLSPEDYADLTAQGVDMYPVVAFWTRDEQEIRAAVGQPLSVTPEAGPVDIGDFVPIRYDSRDPENILIYTGFWSLWTAPVVLFAVGAVFNGLLLIATLRIFRGRL